MFLTPDQKLRKEVERARTLVSDLTRGQNINIAGTCLQHAWAMKMVLGCEVVAGSASWRFTDYDNGINPTHFSYEFEDYCKEQKGQLFILQGKLPEMHVWNIYQGKVLDISTRYWPKQAELAGLTWTTDAPPDFHFGDAKGPRYQYSYREHSAATKIAEICMGHLTEYYRSSRLTPGDVKPTL